jgi:hypothetical protein
MSISNSQVNLEKIKMIKLGLYSSGLTTPLENTNE